MAATEPLTYSPLDVYAGIPTAERSGMTPDEFFRFSSEEGSFELIRGEVIQLPPTGGEHGAVGGDTYSVLREFVKAHDLGVVLIGETGYILERDPYTVRAPDVSFLSKSRLVDGKPPRSFIPGAPDLAVEILSPSDALPSAEAKARMYLRAGGQTVWILNPVDQTLRIYRNGEETQVRGPNDEADAEPALPGFRCPVARLFGA
jgi:Uma2 family endonuclease